MDIKVGDKLICINDDSHELWVNKGQVYECIEHTEWNFYLNDNMPESAWNKTAARLSCVFVKDSPLARAVYCV